MQTGFLVFLRVIIGVALSGFRVAQEYQPSAVFPLGRYQALEGPGLYRIIPLIEWQRKVDLRTVTVSLEPHETIIKDSATAKVSGVLSYKIVDPERAIVAVENYRTAV